MSSAQVPSFACKGEGPLVLPVPQPLEWYYLEIHVRPKPKERPRVTKGGFAFTPADTILFEMRVRLAALQSDLPYWVNGAVGLACYFTMPRSSSDKSKNAAWCVEKPDRDNLEKSILDALNGVVVRDDEQISFGAQWKMVVPESEETRVRLYIFPLEGAIAVERTEHSKMLADTVKALQSAHGSLRRKEEKKVAKAEARASEREAKRLAKKEAREAEKAAKKSSPKRTKKKS